MSQNKYVSLSKLSTFLDNLYDKFASISHKHTLDDIANYTVDSQLSPTSTNPVANSTLNAEFDAVSYAMEVLEDAIDNKADRSLVSEAENGLMSSADKIKLDDISIKSAVIKEW